MAGSFRIFYLHGFASSPGSRKACFFAERLASCGIHLEIPDMERGNFRGLTISGQLAFIESLVQGEPVILIGSSLGGYLAALYAARHPEVKRLVLLAPAFGFHQLWVSELGPERLSEWQKNGELRVFHYAEGREVPLGYQFIADAENFEPFPDVRQPALIFHGTSDAVVPVQQSQAFVQNHPNARLVQLPSGHELTDVLEVLWTKSESFLLGEAVKSKAELD